MVSNLVEDILCNLDNSSYLLLWGMVYFEMSQHREVVDRELTVVVVGASVAESIAAALQHNCMVVCVRLLH